MSEKQSLKSKEKIKPIKEKAESAYTLEKRAKPESGIATNMDKLSSSAKNDKRSNKSTKESKHPVNRDRRRKQATSRSIIDEEMQALCRGLGKMGLDPSMENRDEEGWLDKTADPPEEADESTCEYLDWDSPGVMFTGRIPYEHEPSLGVPIPHSQDDLLVFRSVDSRIEDDDTEIRPVESEIREPRSGIRE
ncbi:hypothetical protein I302_102288 [Kwoniella bestiolae CBS 10118]|uniref:Uncharacterized protein n=1 Tax=Kwoniella bestiolae CBS 10118 TaxID=1296100 RepID=A0A1B9GEM2_9TREE|nr:hypothetical protein I302_00980 [Kwoniella bestiolae CBS 10118]OCF29474.1 hypothetical protein I302_00980 [Kwoniella bestiolae CBS 10118]